MNCPNSAASERCLPWLGLPHLIPGWVCAGIAMAAAMCLLPHRTCHAGLTASEVVLVVNGGSLNSRTLANHYVRLRGIPPINVIVIDSVPNSDTATVDEFRERILRPVLDQITKRKLAGHIQCIAYSADFPTAINIEKDLEVLKDRPKIYTPRASINSLTYMYELAFAGNPAYVLPESNYYARRAMESYFTNPGGSAYESAWRSIERQIAVGQHKEATDELKAIAQQLPHQFPIKYLAAAQAAKSRQYDDAVKLLEEAVRGGWNSGGYLEKDLRFLAIRRRDDFQLLELSLDDDAGRWQPTIGFNQRSYWAPNGVRFSADPGPRVPGMRYLLSVVLGVTRGGGTSLQDAIDALTRASTADYTHPEGGFYFSATDDIRTRTREPLFNDAIAELKRLGFEAEIINGSMPSGKKAVLGAQLGTPRFNWTKSMSNLVPGSIAENLTSFGGVMATPGGHTKLTELIKAGAAGSSGTVTEPFAIQAKFPTPYLYVHYAQGATLVEAFYQSVSGPYQLLIVGDPLCQPFSIAPDSRIDQRLRRLEGDQSLIFELNMDGPKYAEWVAMSEPASKRKKRLAPARVAVQVDGTSPRGGAAQKRVDVKLSGVTQGYHEVQVLSIADDPINQRSMATIPIWIGSPGAIQLHLQTASKPTGGNASKTPDQPAGLSSELRPVSLQAGTLLADVVTQADCHDISIWHDFEAVAVQDAPSEPTASTPSEDGEPNPRKPGGPFVVQQTSPVSQHQSTQLSIPIASLGMGPVRLQAKAKLADGTVIASLPVWIEVVP